MNRSQELSFIVDRELFFGTGRALQRGIGNPLLGSIRLEIRRKTLTILSTWGGSQMPCEGDGNVSAELAAKAFCSLITTRYREKAPSGRMKIVFRPDVGEFAIDRTGVKARVTVDD